MNVHVFIISFRERRLNNSDRNREGTRGFIHMLNRLLIIKLHTLYSIINSLKLIQQLYLAWVI